MQVPSAKERGTFRCGFLTSPAVNVMLFQASAEKSEPTWATQRATNKPNAVSGPRPAATGGYPAGVHMEKFAASLGELRPAINPTAMTPDNAAIFEVVKTF